MKHFLFFKNEYFFFLLKRFKTFLNQFSLLPKYQTNNFATLNFIPHKVKISNSFIYINEVILKI